MVLSVLASAQSMTITSGKCTTSCVNVNPTMEERRAIDARDADGA
ncbi:MULTISPECIES: hypothetical protein [Burkholderia]|nr:MULTISPECIES: hypothetical protein [Burkholderia]